MPGPVSVIERADPFQSALQTVLAVSQIKATKRESQATEATLGYKKQELEQKSQELELSKKKIQGEISAQKVDAFMKLLPILAKHPIAASGVLNKVKGDPDLTAGIPGLSDLDVETFTTALSEQQDLKDALEYLKATTPALGEQLDANSEVAKVREQAAQKVLRAISASRSSQGTGEQDINTFIDSVLGK